MKIILFLLLPKHDEYYSYNYIMITKWEQYSFVISHVHEVLQNTFLRVLACSTEHVPGDFFWYRTPDVHINNNHYCENQQELFILSCLIKSYLKVMFKNLYSKHFSSTVYKLYFVLSFNIKRQQQLLRMYFCNCLILLPKHCISRVQDVLF